MADWQKPASAVQVFCLDALMCILVPLHCMTRNLCEWGLGEYAAVCGLTCQHKDACQTGGVAAEDQDRDKKNCL